MLKIFLRWFGHQDWIRFGFRNRIIRAFYPYESHKADFKFSVPFYGYVFRGTLNNLIDFETYFYGAYAKPELDLFVDVLGSRNDSVVWDVGANVGHHSLFFSKYAKHVMSFEPYPPVAKCFEQRMIENEVANVSLNKVGLSDNHNKLPFCSPQDNNNGSGFFVEKIEGNGNGEVDMALMLELTRGDDFANKHKLERLDFLKIDVEGHEKQVLNGLMKTLDKFRPAIFMEWSSATDNNFTYSELIASLPEKYQIFQFIDRTPFLLFFELGRYRLELVITSPEEGNLLLLPEEWLLRV